MISYENFWKSCAAGYQAVKSDYILPAAQDFY